MNTTTTNNNNDNNNQNEGNSLFLSLFSLSLSEEQEREKASGASFFTRELISLSLSLFLSGVSKLLFRVTNETLTTQFASCIKADN